MDNLKEAREYWNVASKSLPAEYKDHWIDEAGNPLDALLYQEVAEYVLSFLHNNLQISGESILEVGCGTGRILHHLSKLRRNLSLYGIDFSTEQIEFAKKTSFSGASFEVADIEEFSVKYLSQNHKGFDLIFLHSVTQYFPSDDYFDDFLEAAYKLLKKGGSLLIIDTPIRWYLEEMRSKPPINSKTLLRDLIKSLIGEGVMNKLRSRNQVASPTSTQEAFGEFVIEVPIFKGYWASPEVIEHFAMEKFERFEMVFQNFRSKPVAYKKFRPNFLLSRKK